MRCLVIRRRFGDACAVGPAVPGLVAAPRDVDSPRIGATIALARPPLLAIRPARPGQDLVLSRVAPAGGPG
jgi:hypothetical protein